MKIQWHEWKLDDMAEQLDTRHKTLNSLGKNNHLLLKLCCKFMNKEFLNFVCRPF